MKVDYLDIEKHTGLPPEGFVQILRERYWVVHPEEGLKICRGPEGGWYSPQCNANESLVERFCGDDHVVQFHAFVWLPHDCQDYV